MVMRSSAFKNEVEPVLNTVFDGVYNTLPQQWSEVFEKRTPMDRAEELVTVLYGFGAAPIKPSGTLFTYDDGGEAYTAVFTHEEYGLAFAATEALLSDAGHIQILSRFSKHLAFSMNHTRELVGANVLNRAFNSSYVGADGVSLINTAHTLVGGGTYSNQLTVAANLSEGSLEQLNIQIDNAVNQRGLNFSLKAKKLVIPTAQRFNAERILNSPLRSGTANNDLNAQKSLGLIPEGYSVINRLTSTSAYFLTTDAPDGLIYFERWPLKKGSEGDFETGNGRYKAYFRISFGWVDPYGIFGTAGV